jgi:uncharacterized membrane protein YdjX (TVP38/TMEM64 family)
MRIFASDRSRRRVLVHLAVAVVVLVGLYLLARRYLPFLRTPEAFRAWLLGFGIWAPVVFVLVQTLQVLVAPIPGQVIGLASGYVFGVTHGTVYSMTGTLLGTTLAFAVARRFGRPYVERFVADDSLGLFDDVVADDGRLAVFVSFVLPGLPDDVLCFVAGLTKIPLWQLAVLAFVGRFPSVFLLNLAGAEVARDSLYTAGALLGGLVVVSAVVIYYRRRIVGHFE